MLVIASLLLHIFLLTAHGGVGWCFQPGTTRKGILQWQVQLSPDQCGSSRWTPCYNVYAVNETHGDLVWFAFTTSNSAVKGMSLGHHSVYYTTWSGPGLYAVNAATGHVRWQFPLDNWFRYWVKDIDLDRSASFGASDEVRDVVYVTADGPPARVYALRTKSGAQQWEYKLPQPSAVLADVAGPPGTSGRHAALFMAVNQPSSNSSWVQALSTASGSVAWQTLGLNDTVLDRLELQDDDGILLATTAAADAIHAFDAASGALLWSRRGSFCSTPSPIADVVRRQLLLSDSCDGLSGLTAVDLDTGRVVWEGWSAPSAARPLRNCSSYSQADGTIFFGCSCHTKVKWQLDGRQAEGTSSRKQGKQAASASAALAQQAPGGAGDGAHKADAPNGVCLYALNSRNGKLRWVLPMAGNASFPPGAQQWGAAPVIHGNLAVYLASDRMLAVDIPTGRLRWSVPLSRSEALQAHELPVVDADSSTLVLAAQVVGSTKTGLSGVSLREGRLLWHKTVNGTMQRGGTPSEGPQQLVVRGGRVYVESCRSSRCCLRALNVTTGRQRWGMCLDALQGDDATHPHAQFAIWFITLLTICSIALLILGAGLVYIQRWNEERRILYGAAAPSSPRHSYQPLPPQQSDSEDG